MSLGLSLSFWICEWEQGKEMIDSYLLASSEFLAKDRKVIGLRSNFIDFRPWFLYSFVATLTSFLVGSLRNVRPITLSLGNILGCVTLI